MGSKPFGLEFEVIRLLAEQIKDVHALGVEVALVIGGGNIYRGLAGSTHGIDRVTGDYMGMLATVINSLAVQDALERLEVHTRGLSGIEVPQGGRPYIRRPAMPPLEKGRVASLA